MKTISLTLPNALAAKLSATARRRQTSQSSLVREAIEAYFAGAPLAPSESFVALAGDLIGSLNDGPGDLAHNKKHLEDYGR